MHLIQDCFKRNMNMLVCIYALLHEMLLFFIYKTFYWIDSKEYLIKYIPLRMYSFGEERVRG